MNPVTDAGKMALLAALRRDWKPYPATQNYGQAMTEVLVEVALAIDAEMVARTYTSTEDFPWTSTS